MADKKLQTEKVSLPSKGLLYSDDSPLRDGTIEVKYMTAKEEDILTNQSFIKSGIVIDKLLEALVVSPINFTDLLIGDKNAILVAARVYGYGPHYVFNYTNPKTQAEEEVMIDLSLIEDKELDESAFNVWRPCIERNNKVRIENDILFRVCRDGRDWHEYINYINFPTTLNKTYDVILIDGRARPNCAFIALSLLKKDGVVVVHDFKGTKEEGGRWYYQGILHYYDIIDSGDSLVVLKPKNINED